jgi:hypothetical protein
MGRTHKRCAVQDLLAEDAIQLETNNLGYFISQKQDLRKKCDCQKIQNL